jgi:hypothetical protein
MFVFLALLGLSACAAAHGPKLDFSSLDHLKGEASDVVDIDLGPLPLAIGAMFIGDDDPEADAIRDTLRELKSVHVRHYEFNADFEYPTADIDAIRAQLSKGSWTQLAKVRSRKDGHAVDVYVGAERDRITGLAILASGRRELTVINVVVSFDLQKLERLREKYERDHDEWGADDAAWRH